MNAFLWILLNMSLRLLIYEYFSLNTSLQILLNEYFSMKTSLWILLNAYFSMKTSLWILLYEYFTMNTSQCILLSESFSMNTSQWILLYESFSMTASLWMMCSVLSRFSILTNQAYNATHVDPYLIQTRNVTGIYHSLKGVFAKNERVYRLISNFIRYGSLEFYFNLSRI